MTVGKLIQILDTAMDLEYTIRIKDMSMNPLDRLESILKKQYKPDRHLTSAANDIYMAALRTGIDLNRLLDLIESGESFDLKKFTGVSEGNVFDFVCEEIKDTSRYFIDITAGGNGGMASIGRGEFFVAFLTNFLVTIVKSGSGDLLYPNEGPLDYPTKSEEWKWNGGKINVDDMQGRVVAKNLMQILADRDEKDLLKTATFVPFRKTDKKKYDVAVINKLNARFWEAITGEEKESLTDQELKKLCLRRACKKLFDKTDALVVADDDGSFVRFTNAESAVKYYDSRVDSLEMEIRASQSNPVAFYLTV